MDGNYVFVDTETTGLEPGCHEIIDIWAAVVTPGKLEIIDEAGGLITPLQIGRADPRAIECNGYTPGKWQVSKPFLDVWGRIQPLIKGRTWVGQNIVFDLKFIRATLKDHMIQFGWPRRNIDIKDLAKNLVRQKVIPNAKLDTLCQHFSIDSMKMWGLEAHGARADVYRSIEVYRNLRRVLGWNRYAGTYGRV